jgi:hypothetical protein
MADEYKSNIPDIAKKFGIRARILENAVVKGLEDGLYKFQTQIIRKQLSGRPGLKVRTGKARGSWRVRIRRAGARDVAVTLGSTAWYLEVHQKGKLIRARRVPYLVFRIGNRWIRKKQVRIPKRLRILEDFKAQGQKILKQAALRRVKIALAGG